VGRLPTKLQAKLGRSELHGLAAVVNADRNPMTSAFYQKSHALVSYLLNRRPELLASYLRTGTFGDMSIDDVTAELGEWLQTGSHTILTFGLKGNAATPGPSRRLGDADVYVTRALLMLKLAGRARVNDASAAVHAAVAAEPTHVLANVMAFGLGDDIDEARARAMVEAHPDQWMAWFVRGASLPKGSRERVDAQRRMCELAAKERRAAIVAVCGRAAR
jgi:hypothetical protein